MFKQALKSVAATVSIFSSIGIMGSAVNAATFISFDSSPGDYIGGGIKQTFTPVDGSITASHYSDSVVSINFYGDSYWSLDFAAANGALLTPGIYEGATRFPSSTEPGLDVSGDGRGCNTLTGRFNVLDVSYGDDGSVERFNADFEQSCEGFMAPLFGQVRFDKTTSVATPEEIKENIQQIDPASRAKLLSFSDKIEEFSTALYFFSEPGDYIGLGLEQIFTPNEVDFSVSSNFGNGLSFYVNNFSKNDPQNYIWWSLDFAVPEVLSLVPGDYAKATRFPFNSPTKPGLSVYGEGRGCNTLKGQFIVLDAMYGENQAIESFDAIFEQRCEETGPPLYGRIRYNVPLTPPESVPEPAAVLGLLGMSSFLLIQRRSLKRR